MDAATPSADIPIPRDGLRDTIDSIIVAFILAFVFRAFVVEAFIIPTGSMAPTLYGMHGQIRCANCAYPFAYNMRAEAVASGFRVRCPNCNDENDVPASPANPLPADSGDRILVLKWPYDIGGPLLGPKRWDVSVFKDPKDSRTNFIKRLIGLPGEVLMIVDGDVYSTPSKNVPPDLLKKLRPGHRQPLAESDFRVLDRLLQLQRKTSVAQQSLWMLHYDHDFPPAHLEQGSPVWTPEKNDNGWTSDSPRLRFDGREGDDAFVALTGKPVADNYGYNSQVGFSGDRLLPTSDVRLELVLKPRLEKGNVTLSLSKDGTEFRGVIHADGTVDLGVVRAGRPGYVEPLGPPTKIAPLVADRPVSVAMQNVDYRVTLEVDGKAVAQTTDAAYKPDLATVRRLEQEKWDGGGRSAQVRVGAAGMPCELWHVRVMRDVYYRPHPGELDGAGQLASGGAGTLGHAILLRETEYFMCGDNSPQSADSRMWKLSEVSPFLRTRGDDYQVGTVPEDQMIGKAFFVYWPSGKRLVDRGGPPIVPNTGKMRIIR